MRSSVGRHNSDLTVLAENLLQDQYQLKRIARDGMVVVDIGAHIGIFAVVCASLSHNARIYSYEPERSNYALLVENAKLNPGQLIRPSNKAVAGERGTLKLFLSEQNTGAHTTYGDGDAFQEVECTTLRDVMADLPENRLDLLKIDCEGREFEILMTAEEGDLSRIDRILMETHHGDHTRDQGWETLYDRLRNTGFVVERSTIPVIRTTDVLILFPPCVPNRMISLGYQDILSKERCPLDRYFQIPMNPAHPHVTIVIVNWNHKEDTLECLESVSRLTYPSYSIILVDNGSNDGSTDAIEKWSRDNLTVTLIRNDENLGFVHGSNMGIRHALTTETDYVFLLNNDTTVQPGTLSILVGAAEQAGDIGMVGPKIYQYGKRRVLDSAGTRTIPWLAQGFLIGHGEEDRGQFDYTVDLPYVTGTALLVRLSVLKKTGVMDEDFFHYFDDFDWGLRTRKAGFRLLLIPEAVICHKGANTIGFGSPFYMHQMIRSRIIFARKHVPQLLFLIAFLPYLILYRYLRPAILLLVRRKWSHLRALHRGIREGFATPITSRTD